VSFGEATRGQAGGRFAHTARLLGHFRRDKLIRAVPEDFRRVNAIRHPGSGKSVTADDGAGEGFPRVPVADNGDDDLAGGRNILEVGAAKDHFVVEIAMPIPPNRADRAAGSSHGDLAKSANRGGANGVLAVLQELRQAGYRLLGGWTDSAQRLGDVPVAEQMR